jgi:hypothetical protein
MQPNMQQIPQQQMMIQNPQIQMGIPQQIPQNQNQQLYQIVQSDSSPNRCEKFSKWLTGAYNVPLIVFLILMGTSGFFIFCLFLQNIFPTSIFTFSAFGNFLFALYVWSPMAIKIEKNTTTVRYGCLYLINKTILSIFSLSLGFQTIWTFVLFETLLIALSNKDKKMKFFCFKISGRGMIICSIIYSFVFNMIMLYQLIVTIIYTYVYQKWLINRFAISNEKVEKIENWCCISWLKNKLATFTTLKDVLEKGQQNQPLVQNNNIPHSNNSSFIPVNMYPNYYSGIAPGMQQMPIQPQAQPISSVESSANLQ